MVEGQRRRITIYLSEPMAHPLLPLNFGQILTIKNIIHRPHVYDRNYPMRCFVHHR